MKTKITVSVVTAFVLAALVATSVFARGMFAPPAPGDFKLSDEALEAAAEVLGITTDELSAALEEGTTLDELAETTGVDVQDVLDAIREAMPVPEGGFAGKGKPGDMGASGDAQLTDEALAAAAEVLGITTDELSAALEEGSTLEELAETAGVDIQDVLDAIREVQPMPEGGLGGGPGNMQLSDEALAAAAEVLGITADELSAALEEGTTLDELAETAGVDVQDVLDAISEVQPMPNGGTGGGPGGNAQLSDEALAAAAEVLGITTDELSVALEEGTTLDELAETAGVDVQDVLDAISEVQPMPNGGPGGGPGGNAQLSDEALTAAAEALGITTDELSAALEEGTTLDELAETAGVDIQDVLDAISEVQPAPQQSGQQPGGSGQPVQAPSGQPGQAPNGQPGQMPGQPGH